MTKQNMRFYMFLPQLHPRCTSDQFLITMPIRENFYAFSDDVPDRYFEYAPGGALFGGEDNKDDFGGGEVNAEFINGEFK